MKKKLMTGLVCALAVFLLAGIASAAFRSLALTAQPQVSDNYVALNWTNSDTSQPYYYMIAKSDDSGTTYQTIPLKSTAKVLNIYPGAGTAITGTDLNGRQLVSSASVKSWMETDGFGKSLIAVDCVLINDFNSNPSQYLFKQEDGSYNYNVVFIGSWDNNNGADGSERDVTEGSKTVLQDFIDAGGGYLGGHDTANGYFLPVRRLNELAVANLNMLVGTDIPMYGKTTIPGTIDLNVIKKGSLVNYPWELSGTTLTIPSTHTTRQFAMGDVWMEFATSSTGGSEITSYSGQTGTNNFYLTTWNNAAMIQTGHSNGTATDDEKKVIANTLLYLSQISGETSFDDHTGQDVSQPDSISQEDVDISIGADWKAAISFPAPDDNGDTYFYKLKAMGVTDNSETWSDPVSCTNISGIAGYAIAVDQNSSTDPGDTVTTTECGYNTDALALGTSWYVHIKAIDHAGNIGETVHVQFAVTNRALATNNLLAANPGRVTPGDTITLSATGDRQRAEGETVDDERYIPVSWVSTETGKAGTFTLSGGTYNSTYIPSSPGDYTVSATFKKQAFDGEVWNDEGSTDIKTVAVRVYSAAQAIATATPKPTAAPTKAPASTKAPTSHKTATPAPTATPATLTSSPLATLAPIATATPVPTARQTQAPLVTPTPSLISTIQYGNIEGILLDSDGKPISGATIELHSDPMTTVTDAKGRFAFENVALTEHTLSVYVKEKLVGEIPLSFQQSDAFSTTKTLQGVSVSYTSTTATINITLVTDAGLSSVQVESVAEAGNVTYWWWILSGAFVTAAALYLIWRFKRKEKA